jgi:hypothetical protein
MFTPYGYLVVSAWLVGAGSFPFWYFGSVTRQCRHRSPPPQSGQSISSSRLNSILSFFRRLLALIIILGLVWGLSAWYLRDARWRLQTFEKKHYSWLAISQFLHVRIGNHLRAWGLRLGGGSKVPKCLILIRIKKDGWIMRLVTVPDYW